MSIVTLTTDFGTRDAYVAELKGVLCSEGPSDLRIVDLSHELSPFDVSGAALFVRTAVPRFPAGTVHVVVVDPGVGSARAPLVARLGEQLLVGPDNGVLGYLFEGREEVFTLDPSRLGARSLSSTFHGRDLFAPAAARLVGGARPESLGTRTHAYERLTFPPVETRDDVLFGRIVHVDHFGNLISNVSASSLAAFLAEGGVARVFVSGHAGLGLVDHYAQAARGELLALLGSSGLLEVAAREANAAARLDVGLGAVLRVERA